MLTTTMMERFSDKVQSAVGFILPGMFKRLMYISSLLSVIDVQPTSDQALARKLNDIFQLGKNPSAVTDTMFVKEVLWKEFAHEKSFTYHGKSFNLDQFKSGNYTASDLDSMARHLIETTPQWIKYANEDVMRYDIKKLVRSLPELSAA
jgi:hypothetical protein